MMSPHAKNGFSTYRVFAFNIMAQRKIGEASIKWFFYVDEHSNIFLVSWIWLIMQEGQDK